MSIDTISQTISTIPEAGHRGIDVQTTFVTKQEDFQDHLQGTTVTELNTLKTQINTTVTGMNDAVTNVNTKANEASTSASSASNSAGVATTKAGEASTSASQALASKNKAAQWADADYNVEVEVGKYSAKHWATEANNVVNNKVDKDMSSYTGKTTPVDADLIPLSDSASGFGIKKLSWANIKATLKTYFDSLYMALTGNQTIGGNKSFTGNLLMTGSSSVIGYGIGSGGTVTQLTNKSTAVTLNKPTGQIIMNNAALASNTTASFQFLNSLITTSDMVIVTLNNRTDLYNVWSGTLSNGSCFIDLKNISGGSLSDSIIINFTIIKGATA